MLAVFVWFAAHYWESITNHFLGKSEKIPRDLIPLSEGVDIALVDLEYEMSGNHITLSLHSSGKLDFESILFEMCGGTDGGIPIYAVKPPRVTPKIIPDIYDKYKIQSDDTAINNMDPGDTLTTLQVRRSDVKRWIKKYLRGPDDE